MTWRHRLDVVRELAVSDFRLKYHDSALGYVWSMLSPALMLAVFYLVFRYLIVVNVPGYVGYLAVGLVYWLFFQDCTCSGVVALVHKAELLRAVRVPAVLVLVGAAASTMLTLVINTVVLVLALAVTGRLSSLAPLALVPLLGLVLLASGVGFLVALAHVRFRDTSLIWSVLLQALFWMTPVVYHVSAQWLWPFYASSATSRSAHDHPRWRLEGVPHPAPAPTNGLPPARGHRQVQL
jgi:ABC-2 type transport system permease protein